MQSLLKPAHESLGLLENEVLQHEINFNPFISYDMEDSGCQREWRETERLINNYREEAGCKERWLCAAGVRDNREGDASLRLHSSLLFQRKLKAAAGTNTDFRRESFGLISCLTFAFKARWILNRICPRPAHQTNTLWSHVTTFKWRKVALCLLLMTFTIPICLHWFQHPRLKKHWNNNLNHYHSNKLRTLLPDSYCKTIIRFTTGT